MEVPGDELIARQGRTCFSIPQEPSHLVGDTGFGHIAPHSYMSTRASKISRVALVMQQFYYSMHVSQFMYISKELLKATPFCSIRSSSRICAQHFDFANCRIAALFCRFQASL